jgi:hypothetical protein
MEDRPPLAFSGDFLAFSGDICPFQPFSATFLSIFRPFSAISNKFFLVTFPSTFAFLYPKPKVTP